MLNLFKNNLNFLSQKNKKRIPCLRWKKNRQSTSRGILPSPAIDIFQNFLLLFRISIGKYMLKVPIKKLKQINKLRLIGLMGFSL